ncbi:UNVERIFIED_CONTAM: hypothetical protein FKN15_011617 [Acipenser sinensis]
MYNYLDSLSNVVKERCSDVIGCNLKNCLYKLPDDAWVNDPTKWHEVQFPDIYIYLTETPDPKESHAIPESVPQEGPQIEAVYTQEESFDQEWCASLIQVTEQTFVKDEEVPQQECVPIKEEFIEQECVSIAEELPTENNVCTLEENKKLGSNLCDDSPYECELGFRGRGLCKTRPNGIESTGMNFPGNFGRRDRALEAVNWCTACGEWGHLVVNCPILQEEEEKEKHRFLTTGGDYTLSPPPPLPPAGAASASATSTARSRAARAASASAPTSTSRG